jgi:hypothetical protein
MYTSQKNGQSALPRAALHSLFAHFPVTRTWIEMPTLTPTFKHGFGQCHEGESAIYSTKRSLTPVIERQNRRWLLFAQLALRA